MSEQTNSLQSIFLEALEIEDHQERAAFLARTCGSDSALRQEVEALIHAHTAAPQFLPEKPEVTGVRKAVLSAAEAALSPDGTPDLRTADRTGDRIGHYKLLEQIGEGGCGVVFMAEQTAPVQRRVALKVIKLGMDTRQVVARFEAERQALALMDHPNIARVFDAGATEKGGPYFVMELVRGIKITQFCDENELSTRERLELFIQVCLAVQHAHQKGVIHRDLKPSNVLVTFNDSKPVPKIIDFGIAKATQGRLTDKTLFTAFEQFLGTPAYMSPEQTVMTNQDIDTRSDIYSLGVLLYELLTGKTPFDTKELLSAGLEEMRRTIREKEPVRPSTRLKNLVRQELTTTAKRRRLEPPKLIQLLRGDLDSIVGKCLEKERSRRYETATGLVADVQRFLNHEPIVARPAGLIYRLTKVAQRNKWAFASGTAVAVALVGGTIASRWQALRAERERQRFQQNLVHQYVANGTDLVNKGDLFGSLLCYTKALELDAGDPQREEPHRIRIASVLRQCPKLLNVFSHGELLYDAKFSPDGERLVTASDDHTARIWDVTTGAQLLVLEHQGEVYDATFSPDGSRIVTSSQDKTARIWDSRSGALLQSLRHGDTVWRSRFSPDGQLVATACEDHTVQLWDPTTGAQVGESLRHASCVYQLVFSPDGRLLGTTAGDGTAQIWDVASRQSLRQFAHTANRTEVAFSPDSQRFAAADGSNLRVWDARTLKEVPFSPLAHDSLLGITFSPDGRYIVSSSLWDFTARVWDAATGQALFSPGVRHEGPIRKACISPDGRFFATPGNDAVARVWRTETGLPVSPPLKLIHIAKYVAFNADGRRLLVNSCDQAVRIWDLATGDGSSPSRPTFENEQCVVSPDGRWVLQLGSSNRVWIVDTRTTKNVAVLPHTKTLEYASFSRDNRTVVTVSSENNAVSSMTSDVLLWEVPTGRRRNSVSLGPTSLGRIYYAAFSPDNRRLLTCSLDFSGRLWDAQTGRPLGAPLQHRGRVTWGAFSPDGRSVVTASWEKTVRVWNSATGSPRTPPLQHKSIVTGAIWSADGKRLRTLTQDDYLQVWDLSSGEPLTPPQKIRDLTVASRSAGGDHPHEDLHRDDRAVADLVVLSQMLAVGRIDETGNVVPLQLAELKSATDYLRRKYPRQFEARASEVFAWHRREAEQSEADGNLTAALFHVDRALKGSPGDQDLLHERLDLDEAVANGHKSAFQAAKRSRRIPAREPMAGPQQIDLSGHYNFGLQDSVNQKPDDNDLADLPAGVQTFGGVRFDVRGLIHLNGQALQQQGLTYPESCKSIRVGRKCRLLHFLQGAAWDSPAGTEVGRYVLHYADGQQQELPIVYGRDLAGWWFWGLPDELKEPDRAVVAWTGHNTAAAKGEASICLWKSTRLNPRPDVQVVSIDFLSAMKRSAPFLIALTAE